MGQSWCRKQTTNCDPPTWLAVAEPALAVAPPVARVDAQRGVAVHTSVDLEALEAEAVSQDLAGLPRVVPGAVTPGGCNMQGVTESIVSTHVSDGMV